MPKKITRIVGQTGSLAKVNFRSFSYKLPRGLGLGHGINRLDVGNHYPLVAMRFNTLVRPQKIPKTLLDLNNLTIEEMVDLLNPVQRNALKIMSTGAMSYGSISLEAHTTIAEGVNRVAMALYGVSTITELKSLPSFMGPMSKSGEGGELPSRNNTIYQSLNRQLASGNWGVTLDYIVAANTVEIKLGQAAKPGKGGELPGSKVTPNVAKARLTIPGITLISPPTQYDILSIEDIKGKVHNIRSANPQARVAIKLVAGPNIGVIAAGCVKCGVDIINIAGQGGGTGAASTSAKHEFVYPWELAVAEVHQTLTKLGLRSAVKLSVSGGIQTGADCMKAVSLGADLLEFGTATLVSLGCVMAEVCHTGTCPKGIATTDEELIATQFTGKPEDVARWLIQTAVSFADYLDYYEFSDPAQAVGRTELLAVKKDVSITGLEKLLDKPSNPYPLAAITPKEPGASYREKTLLWSILQGKYSLRIPASTGDRSFGAYLGYMSITSPLFKDVLKNNPIRILLDEGGLGCGGSFGFALPYHLTLVAPNTNDGTAKSLSGGRVIVKGQAGGITGYGATSGEIFVKKSGGRTGIRNSGAHIVTERVGPDSACFMTGGSLTILGSSAYYPGLGVVENQNTDPLFKEDTVGHNFGAGFTGGTVFLPTPLFNEMKRKKYLASSEKTLAEKKLIHEDILELKKRLNDYRQDIPNAVVDALLALDDQEFASYFVKLAPSESPQAALVAVASVPYEPAPPQVLSNELRIKPTLASGPALPQTRDKDACGTGVIHNRDGQPTQGLVAQAVEMLGRFSHRGATSIDPETGDGCGITFYGLDAFFQEVFDDQSLEKGNYCALQIALPTNPAEQEKARALLHALLMQEKLEITGERQVPVNRRVLGELGQQNEPSLRQLLIKKPVGVTDKEFEKQLIRLHLRFEFKIDEADYTIRPHIVSASPKAMIYKAMTKEEKFGEYFLDLHHPSFKATIAICHSRFATNTLPKYLNIQLFRNLGNNGENNALQQVVHMLTHHPRLKELLQLDAPICLAGFSDSHIMSIFIDLLRLEDYTPEQIAHLTIRRYDAEQNVSSNMLNMLGVPFEGPNASIMTFPDAVILVRDTNGWRPLMGSCNKDQFYCGSEVGAVDMEGDINVFDLQPGLPLMINLNDNTMTLCERQPIENVHTVSLAALMQASPVNDDELLQLTPEKLQQLKLQAGWNEERDRKVMQPLMKNGKDALVSMGDQRPLEVLVKGAHVDPFAFFRGMWSQATNPSLNVIHEKTYMFSGTYIGAKPPLGLIGKQRVEGVLADIPIVNNYQIKVLMKHPSLNARTLDITFRRETQEEGFKQRIDMVCQEAVSFAQEGAILLVMTDLAANSTLVPLHPVIVASFVHDALLKAGLRRNVSLVLQAASILGGREVAQAISIGGVDLVNPYLPLIQSSMATPQQRIEFQKQSDLYLLGLQRELDAFMGAIGIESVSAYRGTKAFSGFGVDADLAKQLGIQSSLGGVGLDEFARMAITQHQYPVLKGMGRLDSDSDARPKLWDQQTTIDSIGRAQGKKTNAIEDKIDQKTVALRNLFFFTPSMVWNKKNPLPICILGGGAGGFYQAQSLLKSGLPIEIIIIEKNARNRFGLLGQGVAPDHQGTRNQAKVLQTLLNDSRVRYFGGVDVGQTVTLDSLKRTYPCLIDCRGAPVNTKLNVTGEDSPYVVPASSIYNAYNSIEDTEEQWPFLSDSKIPEVGIIGNGNVAADVARMLSKSPRELKDTAVNKRYLSLLKNNAPNAVRIFARGNPYKSKMGLNELQQLQAIPSVGMTATFDGADLDRNQMTPDETKLYDFFLSIKDNDLPVTCSKRIHFHFNMIPQGFKTLKHGVEASFRGPDQQEHLFRTKAFIIAIGNQPILGEPCDDQQTYRSGWATGSGGTLSTAESSAAETTAKIKANFDAKRFHHTLPAAAKEQHWQQQAINNQEQLNILLWLAAGNPIATDAALREAKQNAQKISCSPADNAISTAPPIMHSAHRLETDSTKVTVIDVKSQHTRIWDPSSKGDKTLLQVLLDEDLAPRCDCDGSKKCGECMITVLEGKVETSEMEEAIITANDGNSKTQILACAHTLKTLSGTMFASPKPITQKLQEQDPSQSNRLW